MKRFFTALAFFILLVLFWHFLRDYMLKNETGALCLACADLDHLEYLPRGNVALTRRAAKYSKLRRRSAMEPIT